MIAALFVEKGGVYYGLLKISCLVRATMRVFWLRVCRTIDYRSPPRRRSMRMLATWLGRRRGGLGESMRDVVKALLSAAIMVGVCLLMCLESC